MQNEPVDQRIGVNVVFIALSGLHGGVGFFYIVFNKGGVFPVGKQTFIGGFDAYKAQKLCFKSGFSIDIVRIGSPYLQKVSGVGAVPAGFDLYPSFLDFNLFSDAVNAHIFPIDEKIHRILAGRKGHTPQKSGG